MQQVRQAAVAGSFYPGQQNTLANDVNDLLNASQSKQDEVRRSPKAIIVPHAGYIYSGPVAATAYAQLTDVRDTIKRVVLLGHVHRVPVRGLALPGVSAFATSLGEIQIDSMAVTSI